MYLYSNRYFSHFTANKRSFQMFEVNDFKLINSFFPFLESYKKKVYFHRTSPPKRKLIKKKNLANDS